MEKCVIGLRESLRNIREKKASEVILAMDADQKLIEEVLAICSDYGVPVTKVKKKKKLGRSFGIERPAAVVTLLS